MPRSVFADPNDLDPLHDLVHDSWFPLSRIRLEGRELIVPFASRSTRRARDASFDSRLTVHHVAAYEVIDTEEIEIYGINVVSFDPTSSRITIEGGIPVFVHIDVSRFELHVEVP